MKSENLSNIRYENHGLSTLKGDVYLEKLFLGPIHLPGKVLAIYGGNCQIEILNADRCSI